MRLSPGGRQAGAGKVGGAQTATRQRRGEAAGSAGQTHGPSRPPARLSSELRPQEMPHGGARPQGLNKGILKFKNGCVPTCLHLFSEYLLASRTW